MTILIGNLSLCAAVLAAIATLLVSLRAVRFAHVGLCRTARRGIFVLATFLSISSAALLVAMLQSDFRLAYVARYTERALPVGYKLAAFWAGQEGSLLLWGWMLAMMAVAFATLHRNEDPKARAAALGTLAVVIGFFAALMLFAANPFAMLPEVPADGHGLNPMLQDPGMIAHPPILFLGYAGFTIPFALLIGALVAKKVDSTWLIMARPWILISWIFLGAGILLGAWWAYGELGWGGYWAWDPVENASLLPWLTGTALLHSTIGQRHRGMFKRWNAILAAATFILCIFGTYITRSGIVDSVHTFGQSLVGTFFGVFLTITCLATALLIAMRWNALHSERPLQDLVSREGAFLAGNIIFVGMMLLTLLGTIFPALSRHLSGQAMSVSPSFYNRAVLPLALGLLTLMALAPLLTYGQGAMRKLSRGLGLPLIMAALAVATLWALNIHSAWALASAAASAVVAGSIVVDLIQSVSARQKNTRENPLVATLHLVDSNHRRYGSHVVHAGIVMIVAGIAGSSLYNTKSTVQVGPGQSVAVGKYTLTLDSIQEVRGSNYTAVAAKVSFVRDDGLTHTLEPQRRFYDKAEEASSEVAIRSNWKEDLYVTLAGWEQGGRVTTLQVIVNPLVRWIWAGGVVLCLGAIFCLLPRIAGKEQTAPAPVRSSPGRRPRVRVAVAH